MSDTSIAFKHLFQPAKIGRLELRNRIVMSPVGTRLAKNGMATEAFKEFYAARARGGVGLIILEPCFVEPEGEGMFLALDEDKYISELSNLVETVHECDARIGVQLYHAGWKPGEKNARFLPPIPPAELSVERIKELIEKFTQAAARAQQAGFDLIEIHAAHGYLLSQFLSPLGNQRNDEYGDDVTGRTRFVREIIQSVRKEVGTEFPLSCRINGAENIPGGSTVEDAKEIAPLLVKEGLNLISVSAGALGSYPLTIPPFDTLNGCYVYYAERIKKVVNVPVLTAGRINTPEMAEDILFSGSSDLVAIARGLAADPEFPNKARNGESDRIRKCIACNACLDSDYDGHITCTVNPVAGRETELKITPAAQPRKVIIIGAGLAGLEAARVAALRGHEVSLFEEKSAIGGQWTIAASPPHKQEFEGLVSWLSAELDSLGVKPVLSHPVSADEIEKLKPDVVIVATGADPLVPAIAGFDRPNVITAWDSLQNTPVGERVLVIGGGATGLETAEFLAKLGKEVSVVEMLKAFGTDMGGTVYYHLRTRLRKLGIELHKNTEVKEINGSGIVVIKDGNEETWESFDTYVLALGSKPRNALPQELEGRIKELHVIGDASAISNGASAMRQGFETALKL